VVSRTGRPIVGVYTVRRHRRTNGDQYTLLLPNAIAEVLPAGMRFAVELTDEGILYRPIGPAEPTPADLPAWAREPRP
jgi:hypothetical protein